MRAGNPLANGFRAILYVLKGDLDYLQKSLGLPAHNATEPCSWCPCNISSLPWWEMRLWLQLDRYLYTAANILPHMCALFRVPGVSLVTLAPDWQHDKNMGTDMYFYGTVLHMLCYRILGDTPARNLEKVTADIKEAYQELGIPVRFQNLTLRTLDARDMLWPGCTASISIDFFHEISH